MTEQLREEQLISESLVSWLASSLVLGQILGSMLGSLLGALLGAIPDALLGARAPARFAHVSPKRRQAERPKRAFTRARHG